MNDVKLEVVCDGMVEVYAEMMKVVCDEMVDANDENHGLDAETVDVHAENVGQNAETVVHYAEMQEKEVQQIQFGKLSY
jgi:hypothetical protein